MQSGDLYRIRGHCGAPATDFIEYVHVVVYERRMGRLHGTCVLVFGQSSGLRPCDPAPAHGSGEPAGEAEPSTHGGQASGVGSCCAGASSLPRLSSAEPELWRLRCGVPRRIRLANPFRRRRRLPGPASGGSVIPLTPLDQGR